MEPPTVPPGLSLRPPPKSPVKIRNPSNILEDGDNDMEGMTASMQLFTSNAGSIMMGNEAILRDIPPGTAIELKQTVNRILDEIRSENPSDSLAPLNIITSNSDEQSWKAAQVHLAIESRQDSDQDDRPDL